MKLIKIITYSILTSFIAFFVYFGFDNNILLFSIIPYSALSVFFIYLRIGKNKHVKFSEESIMFKKKEIKSNDIKRITINKNFIFDNIVIKGSNWKSYLAFHDVRNEKFNEFKNHIIQKSTSAKVKYKNQNYLLFFIYGFMILISILPLIVKPKLEQINFISDQSISQNAYTNHYSFRVNNIRFQSALEDSINFILCDSVRISYYELPYIPAEPIKTLDDYYELKSDNAMIEFWDIQETRPSKNWVKIFLILQTKPKIFFSETLKGTLIEYSHDQTLKIKHNSSNFFLSINFHGTISVDEILDVVESIEYNE